MFRVGIIFLVALGILAGCKTTEYKRAESDCRSQATASYPPDYRIVTAEGTRLEKIPDGNISCTTISSQTVCDQGTRTIEIPYKKDVKIDLNKEARERAAAACIRVRCLMHGRAVCPKYSWQRETSAEQKSSDWGICISAVAADKSKWRVRAGKALTEVKKRGLSLKGCREIVGAR